MSNIKVLFLASNPKDTDQLALDEEIRHITSKIRASDYRDSIDLISAWAVRTDDLLQMLNQHKPQIVHFSGHGNERGEIILKSDNGESKPVRESALKALFRALKDNIKVVFLNSCFSEEQAKVITQEIDCAVGMSGTIDDNAAIVFAASFYRAIGFGRSIKAAFDQGIAALLLEEISEENNPKLFVKEGVDPSQVILLGSDGESKKINDNKRETAGKIIETIIRPLKDYAEIILPYFENGEYIAELESNSIKLRFKFDECEFIRICERSNRFRLKDGNLVFTYNQDKILYINMPLVIGYLDKYKDHFIALKTVIENLNISNIPAFFENEISVLIEDPYRKRDLATCEVKEECLFKLYSTVITGKRLFNGRTWAVDLKRYKSKEILDIIKKDSYSNEIIIKVENLKNEIILNMKELINKLNSLDEELQNEYYL